MPVSQNQRLRKAAAKAAKRKVVVAEKLARERRELTISKPRHIDFATSPIVACTVSQDVESKGLGTLSVARKLSLGRFGVAVFLLDTWCLGVKDAFFRVYDAEDYEAYCENLESVESQEPIEPARARKYLRDAAAYGLSNGFPPPDNFAECERILGDVPPAEATFAFGQNGRPHYVEGPNDSRSRVLNILKQLESKFGPDGFDYTSAFDVFGDEDDIEYEDDIIEGEAQELPSPEHGKGENAN